MHLSDHSLSQLDEDYLQGLDEGPLRGLSLRLLEDLKEARERLRQNPTNSARPPSSRAPWERPTAGDEDADASDAAPTPAHDSDDPDEASTPPAEPSDPPATQGGARAAAASEKPKRKRGKQPGAPGFGRTQVFQAQETLIHRPDTGDCAATRGSVR
jgi:hypothetical protein